MTLPYLIATLAIALLLVAVGRMGYLVGKDRGIALTEQTHYAKGYNVGWDAGYAGAQDAMRETAQKALEDSFPTSLGGRAIVKALGGAVPPLTRVKWTPMMQTIQAPLTDGADGAE